MNEIETLLLSCSNSSIFVEISEKWWNSWRRIVISTRGTTQRPGPIPKPRENESNVVLPLQVYERLSELYGKEDSITQPKVVSGPPSNARELLYSPILEDHNLITVFYLKSPTTKTEMMKELVVPCDMTIRKMTEKLRSVIPFSSRTSILAFRPIYAPNTMEFWEDFSNNKAITLNSLISQAGIDETTVITLINKEQREQEILPQPILNALSLAENLETELLNSTTKEQQSQLPRILKFKRSSNQRSIGEIQSQE